MKSVKYMQTATLLAFAALIPAFETPTMAAVPLVKTSSSTETLRQCVEQSARAADFSGVISISRPNGNFAYAQGAMAGPGSPAMLSDAQFNIGSAGKMWTAVSIAQLVDARKLNLDDPVGQHLSGLTPQASAVTIRQLLSHSGGMGNFFAPENLEPMKRARSLSDLAPLIANAVPEFTPGSKTVYSNSGFLILGLVIERVSGQSYGDYVRDNIFARANMTNSGMLPGPVATRATGMTNMPVFDADGPPPPRNGNGPRMMGPPPGQGNGPPIGPPPRVKMGPQGAGGPPMGPPRGPLRISDEAVLMGTSAGGSFSTPSDMQKFFTALNTGRLTSTTMLEALTRQQTELLPALGSLPAVYYGLGFSAGTLNGHRWSGHGGGAPGLNVSTATFPADQTTVVVMSNRDPPAADMMMRKIQGVMFDGVACEAARSN
jgi:D-alanyl-D-alanine carboxypeptidase